MPRRRHGALRGSLWLDESGRTPERTDYEHPFVPVPDHGERVALKWGITQCRKNRRIPTNAPGFTYVRMEGACHDATVRRDGPGALYEADGGRPCHVGEAGALDSTGRLKKTAARLSAAMMFSTSRGLMVDRRAVVVAVSGLAGNRGNALGLGSTVPLAIVAGVFRRPPVEPTGARTLPGRGTRYGGIEKPQVK